MPKSDDDPLANQGDQDDAPLARVNAYLTRFGSDVGSALDPLDETGFTELRYGDLAIGINVNVERELLFVLVSLGQLPEAPSAAFYRNLLELNFAATGACAFAIDSERDRLYLRAMRHLPHLTYAGFAHLLRAVATVSRKMAQLLDDTAL